MDYENNQEYNCVEPVKKSHSGVAIAALICGIVSCVFLTSWLGYGCAIAAIICGIIGLSKASKDNSPKGMAIAGLICGGCSLVIGFGLDLILAIFTMGLSLLI